MGLAKYKRGSWSLYSLARGSPDANTRARGVQTSRQIPPAMTAGRKLWSAANRGSWCTHRGLWCTTMGAWCVNTGFSHTSRGLKCISSLARGAPDVEKGVRGVQTSPRKVDIRLHGKGTSNSHGARPVYQNHLDDQVDSDQ